MCDKCKTKDDWLRRHVEVGNDTCMEVDERADGSKVITITNGENDG